MPTFFDIPSYFEMEKFYSNESAGFAVVLLTLLILFLLSLARGTRDFVKVRNANNLFLKVQLNIGSGDCIQGYLRSLGLKEASIVLARRLPKGQKISVELNTLPNFPGANTTAQAQVLSLRSLGGNPEKFLLRVRFNSLSDEAKRPLLDYLLRLSDHPPLPHRI